MDVAAGDAPVATKDVLDVGLDTLNLGATEVLLLDAVAGGEPRTHGREVRLCGGHRHVRHRVLYAVVEPGDTRGEVLRRRDVHAELAAEQTLGTELRVGPRRDGADRELTIELGEGGRAEARVVGAPRRDPLGDVIERRHTRADHRIGAVVDRRLVVRGRQPRGHGRLEVVAVVVAPVVHAGVQRDDQLVDRREHVLDERALAALRAARETLHRQGGALRDAVECRRHRRHVRIFLAFTLHPAVVGADGERLLRADELLPLHHTAEPVHRHLLIGGETHGVAGGGRVGHREEVVVRVLDVAEHARLQVAVVRQDRAHAAADALPPCVVQFADLAVVALFLEVASAASDGEAFGRQVLDLAGDVAVVDLGVVIDRARLGGDRLEAVGVEDAAFDREAELLVDVTGEHVELRRAPLVRPAVRARERAELRLQLQGAAGRPAGDDVDDAAHGVVAVEARRRVFGDFDAVDAHHRHAGPVDPAAERVVERHTVEQHQRAALAARADAAQRHALRRRLRHDAVRSAEETEARYGAQHIVDRHGRRRLDLLGRDDVHAGRRVAEPLLGAARGDHDGLEDGRRLQRHFDFRAAANGLALLGKAARPDHEDRTVRHGVEREAAVRPRNDRLRRGA